VRDVTYIDMKHAQRIADQISAKVLIEGDRAVFKIGNSALGSTLTHEIGGEPWLSAHAVETITGIKPTVA
jgi:hypothetical protein